MGGSNAMLAPAGRADPALDALIATFRVDSGPLRAGESDRGDPSRRPNTSPR